MVKKGKSLSEQINELADPTPKLFDIDRDDFGGDTVARVEDYDIDDEEEIEFNKKFKSKKKKPLPYRGELNEELKSGKYVGKKVKRSELFDNMESEDENGLENDESEDSREEDDGSDLEDISDSDESDDSDEENIFNQKTLNFQAADLLEQQLEEEEEEKERKEEKKQAKFMKGLVSKQEEEKLKAKHTKAQVEVWEKLLKLRIGLQSILTNSFRLPRNNSMDQYVKYDKKVKKNQNNLATTSLNLVKELLELRNDLLPMEGDLRKAFKRPLDNMEENVEVDFGKRRKLAADLWNNIVPRNNNKRSDSEDDDEEENDDKYGKEKFTTKNSRRKIHERKRVNFKRSEEMNI